MDELFNMILDAVYEFFGIDISRNRGPGILRWIFRILLRIFMVLFGILTALISFLQIRRMHRHRWVSVLLFFLLLAGIVLVAWYIGVQFIVT